MEYNINGMAPQQPNIFKRAWQSITLPHYGRTIGFLTLLVITLAVPATIAFLNQRTNLQQKAAGGVNGILQFSSDKAGNNIITTTNSPELYLKVTRPEGWEITTQGGIQKSSPVGLNNIVAKAYAATFCTSPAVCSTTTGVPADQWTPTGDTCMLNNDGDEFPGACYIRNTGGGSNPTATPTPASGGSGGSCSTYNNNCGGCLNQPACAYTDGGQCVSVDPTVGNICPAGKTTWYWANCSTNECTSSGGGSSAKCTSLTIPTSTIRAGDPLLVSPNFTGQPTSIQFWIANNNDTNPANASWTSVQTVSNPQNSSGVTITNTEGFNQGTHLVLMQLYNGSTVVDAQSNANCIATITISGSTGGGSNPTATPTPAAGGGIIPTLTAPTNGSTINTSGTTLWWDRVIGDNNTNTMYHIRVIDNADSSARHADFPAGVTRECGDYFICHATKNNWLQINLPNNGQYTWYVDAEQGTSKGIHTGTFTFTVSGSSGGTPPGQGVTLTQIAIQNIDNGSGGLSLQRITGKTDLVRFFSDPYWKINTSVPDGSQTRKVRIDFYGTDSQGNPIQRATDETITYTGTNTPPPTAASPTRTPFGCEKKPSEMGNDLSDNLYRWVQVNRADSGGQPLSSCQDDHLNSSVCVVLPGTTNAEKNAQCPQNTTSSFVEASTSNWCRNTPGGDATVAHCWQLQYIGSPAGPGASPTAPPPVPTAPTGQPTPTPMPGCTYTQTTCSGTSDAAANKVCSDANINSNWCYGGRCVTCAAALPTATTAPGSPTATTAPNEPTPIPTATPSITPPPPGPASVNFKVILAGIGVKATKGTEAIVNDRPNQRKRDATLYLYEPGVDATGDFSGAKTINNGSGKIAQPKAIEYDDNGKFVAVNFNLSSTFTSGQYQIFVWTPGYLRKRIPNIQTLNAGTNTINQVVTLSLGDANNDNHLDTYDFRDYRACLNQQTTSCLKADFNDDGYIDNDDKHSGKEGNNKPSFLDYNLFVSEFALINGD